MTDTRSNKALQERILSAIKSGQVKMRPKWHFVFRAALATIGAMLLLLTLLYLASFILFILRQTGVLFVSTFGLRGAFAFLIHLPWLLIFFVLVFVVVLEILVRRYSFAYRRPLLYSAFVILLLVLVGGYIVEASHVHRRISMYARDRSVPFARGLYRGYGEQRFRNIHPGDITEFLGNGFRLRTRRAEDLNVIITPRTRIPFDAKFIVGDRVVVFGERKDDTIAAMGVRKVGKE